MEKSRIIMTTALACALFASPTMAKEGGDQYPNGAEGWYAGALPPPGDYFLNYAVYYGGAMKNGNGDKAQLAHSTPTVLAAADALRMVHVSSIKFLGANWAWHFIVPLVYQNVDINALGGNKRISGVGDIIVDPFVLTWHSPNWHFATGLDIAVPLGTYDKSGTAPNGFNNSDPRLDIGANYWSFEPLAAVTFLDPSGWEASGKFMLNFKTENNYTDYQSGDEFHMDYLIGKHIDSWGLGIGGYFLKQFTNDTQGGHTVTTMNYFGQAGMFSDGRKGQVFAFGPSIKYDLDPGKQFILTWDHEAFVENRFGGDKVIFKFVTGL